ncbi:MAG: peptidoglycan D,D-transpeptidase FtsI family protein [Dehalococcoidia bacterium]
MATAPLPGGHVVRWRLMATAFALALAGAGLLARLADLQLIDHGRYLAAANNEHDVSTTIPAPRGTILDTNGNPLAISIPTYDVLLDKRLWSNPTTAQDAATALAPLVHQSPQTLISAAENAPGGTAVAARTIAYDTGQQIIALGLPGVIMQPSTRRDHPEGDLASSLLGFVGRDGKGLTGLERDFDGLLAGTPGAEVYQRDSLGNPIALGPSTSVDAVPGADVELTIDQTIQTMAENELAATVAKTHAAGGTVVVLDPTTGAILALAAQPSYQLSALTLDNLPRQGDFRDHALSDVYEPGSELKLITMSAGIDAGKVNPNTTYLDLGTAVVGGATFHNWDLSTNGATTMTAVLVKSLNLGALWLATKVLGPDLFYQYVRRFGFGSSTGSGIDDQVQGLVRTPEDPTWSEADLATNSFGQGISVSALQLCDAVAAIVNGGNLMRPYIIKDVRSNGDDRVTRPVVRRRVISDATSATLRGMMRAVDNAYTTAHIPGYTAGVKSGTAYVATSAGSGSNAYAAETTIPSFIGFAPFVNPRVLIYVKLDNLQTNDLGGTVAAPMFAHLASEILPYLNVAPDVPQELNPHGG